MKSKKSKTIKKILIDKGVHQSDIAKELGVTLVAVHAVIHGKCKSKRIANRIYEITGVEL